MLEEQRNDLGMLGARPGLGPAGDTSSGCGPVHFAQLVGFSEVRIGRGDALGTVLE